ncbi:MAG: nucleotidyltransferase domain-containing protein [Planctomycetaceae bacterium]
MLKAAGCFADEFAARRNWTFDSNHPLRTYPALQHAWQHSRVVCERVETALLTLLPNDVVSTVAVSGSVGRMDAHAGSDVDLIVVLRDEHYDEPEVGDRIVQQIWEVLRQLGFPVPKAKGIFSQATTRVELCNEELIGQIEASPALFGKRIQLLLDSQPLFGRSEFVQLQSDILDWYQVEEETNDPAQVAYLMNDLQRYQRALAIRYQFQHRDDPLQWRLLNLKFRNSRFLNHFGMLLLLGEMGIQPVGRGEWLRKALLWTPLERIAAVYARRHDAMFHVIARHYDWFLSQMQNPDYLARLEGGIEPTENHAWEEGFHRARQMSSEIQRFLIDRQHDWNDLFMESLTY